MASRVIKLVLEYDGTEYRGFQKQAHGKTIQGELEAALTRLCKEKITVVGAGRTDAGVHALGQVCHFRTVSRFQTENFAKALNALIPRDIAVCEAREMPGDFHARYSALARTYAYFILNRPAPPAVSRRFVHWLSHPLDVEAMNRACRHLIGRHDFSSFLKSGSGSKNPCITVQKAACCRGTGRLTLPSPAAPAELVTFHIKAKSFLYTMVRTIMGALIEIGRGVKSPEDMKKILDRRSRQAAPAAVSPKGLFLARVEYPRKFQ